MAALWRMRWQGGWRFVNGRVRVKRQRRNPAGKKTSPLGETDAAAIDALYGLEPVFEPDAAVAGSDALTQFVTLSCPYCGEQFETRVDLTNGNCAYVEDCQICCQPIEVALQLDEAGALQAVNARRLD
jgi:Cysteine-rich CPXCG